MTRGTAATVTVGEGGARRRALRVVAALASVAYPIGIWIGLRRYGVRGLGVVVLAVFVPLAAVRLWRAPRAHIWPAVRVPLAVAVLIGLGVVLDDRRFVLALPVLINAMLLVAFAGSLRGPVSLVERFARVAHGPLSPERARYCRAVTVVWSAFFVVNGSVAAWLALCAPLSWWTLYTGGIAYGLMGALFAGEYIVRRLRFRVGEREAAAPSAIGGRE